VELIIQIAEKQIAYYSGPYEQSYLQPLVVLNLDAVEVGLHDCKLLQAREQGNGNVRLLALLDLLAGGIGRFASHVAGHVFAQPALLSPGKVDFGRVRIAAGVRKAAIESRVARGPEGDLGYAELPADGAAPLRCRVLNDNARVGVVELDSEFGGVDGLGRGRDSAIPANLLLGQCWVRPSRLRKDFAV